MNITKLKTEMLRAQAPYQPWIKFQTINYEEKIIKLNPLSLKANALFYQFTIPHDVSEIGLIVADQCDKLIFKCDANYPSAHFIGANEQFVHYDFEPNTTYFVVEPYSNFGLIQMEATPRELRSQFSLNDLLNVDELIIEIMMTDCFEERVTIFKDYYLKHLVNYDYSPGLEEFTASIIYSNRLDFSMADLSTTVGYSKRYINMRFNSEYNMTPAKYARIARFQDSLRALIEAPEEFNIADLAYQYGYYDESHLHKDYKSFTGFTPSKMKSFILNE